MGMVMVAEAVTVAAAAAAVAAAVAMTVPVATTAAMAMVIAWHCILAGPVNLQQACIFNTLKVAGSLASLTSSGGGGGSSSRTELIPCAGSNCQSEEAYQATELRSHQP